MTLLAPRIASLVLGCCLTALCGAQPANTEVLITGLRLQRMPSADGNSIAADWVRVSESRIVSSGAEVSNIGPSQWTVFRAAAAQNRSERVAANGSIDIGPGSTSGERFTFLKVGMGLSVPLPGRWKLFGQSLYVDVEPTTGNLITLGGETVRPGGLGLRVQTSSSVAGTLDERSHLVRFDFRAGKRSYMAGLAASSTNNRLSFGESPLELDTTRLRQAFFGLSFPLRRRELTIAGELGDIAGVRRSGLAFFVRSPMSPRE